MSGRALTAGEIAMARAMFGDAIDYAHVRVHHRRWWPFQPRNVAMAPDGHLWFGQDSPLWSEDFSAASLTLQALFIHEMTHVWQAQRSGRWWLVLMRHPFCRYAYRFEEGRSFDRYGIEQQAELVRHAFLLRRGSPVAGAAPLAGIEAVLPFGTQDRSA